MFSVRGATPEDALYILTNLRESDVNEAVYAGVPDIIESGLGLFHASNITGTYTVKGVPVVLFGVVPSNILACEGLLWMCATEDINKIPLGFLRHSKEVMFPKVFQIYSKLHNLVHSGNTKSIQWLTWCGATFHQPVRGGPFGELYYPFTMEVN